MRRHAGASAPWTNWSGRVRCQPAEGARPKSEEEVASLVKRAAAQGLRVRVAGSGHSFMPVVATDGLLLSLEELAGIESHDLSRAQATVRAGTVLTALGAPLRALGLAMANLGDVDVQALGGAFGTGTHGTGRGLGSLSTQVVGLRGVDARGEIVEWSDASEPERMDAARVSLGLLCVVTALRLQLVPAYRLHERTWRSGLDPAMELLDARIRENRHYEFFWLPSLDRFEHKALNPTQAAADDLPDAPGERIGHSARIIPSVRELKFNEMEYSVPASQGRECFLAVREQMRSAHPEVVWPVEYRTLRADETWLGTASGRETVTLSVHQDARIAPDAFFRDIESIFASHGGRPHWGKLHWRSAGDLRALYPRYDDFVALRRELDPEGRFLNEHLEALLA